MPCAKSTMKRKREEVGNLSKKSDSYAKKFKGKPRKEKVVQPHLPKSAGELSSNWLALKQVFTKEKNQGKKENSSSKHKLKRKGLSDKTAGPLSTALDSSKILKDEIWFDDVDAEEIERARGGKTSTVSRDAARTTISDVDDLSLGGFTGLTKRVAIDCEFVGVGWNGKRNMLARVSIVNSHGCKVFDKYAAPQEAVTDYRTTVSGIRASDLKHGTDFKTIQKEVADILKGRILIGHAVKNDLKVLLLDHPKKDTRDTAKYKPFQKIVKSKNPSLKKLCHEILHTNIQYGEHCSVQDAQAAMRLYILHKRQWEKKIKEGKFRRKSDNTKEDEGS